MEIQYFRKISDNGGGYPYLSIPKQVFAALGTRNVILKVKEDRLEVIPQKAQNIGARSQKPLEL